MPQNNPVAAQRRLRMELRRLRDQNNLTQRQVVEALDWSPSKLIRIEAGAVGISTTDLRALLQQYGVTDQAGMRAMEGLLKLARQHAWWDDYRDNFTPQFITFLGLEASATRLRQFQGLAVPGLLQTEEYMRAMFAAYTTDQSRIERAVRLRLERQGLLDDPDGPQMVFVLDEAAVRRVMGGRDVLLRQADRLLELNQRPNIRIHVATFDQGLTPAMRGSYIIAEFPPDEQDAVVFLERPQGSDELIQNDPDQISDYLEAFDELEQLAAAKEDLAAVIDRVFGQSRDEGGSRTQPNG